MAAIYLQISLSAFLQKSMIFSKKPPALNEKNKRQSTQIMSFYLFVLIRF